MSNIAIDTGPLSGGDAIRGIGVYVRELSNRIKNAKTTSISLVDTQQYDLIHLTRFSPFAVSVPKKNRGTKMVLTIYDLIPLIYPDHYPPGVKGKINWHINRSRIRSEVDAVITISETSKKDICRFTGLDPDKVFVTYLAARDVFKPLKKGGWIKEIKSKYSLPDNFVLYTGDVNFNKNIPVLIEGCKKAKANLVIAGKQAEMIEGLDLSHPELRHLRNLSWDSVRRIGFVPDEDLVKIYNLAECYVQPSFYEGFGLPILEALKCGTPVVVAKNQCHVEILGTEFDFFNPTDPEDLAAKLNKPNKAKALPRVYSWELTASQTNRIYDQILS